MSNHTHTMEYAGRIDTRAVWRCTDAECDFTYSRQLTYEQLEELDSPGEEPEVEFPAEWERADEADASER